MGCSGGAQHKDSGAGGSAPHSAHVVHPLHNHQVPGIPLPPLLLLWTRLLPLQRLWLLLLLLLMSQLQRWLFPELLLLGLCCSGWQWFGRRWLLLLPALASRQGQLPCLLLGEPLRCLLLPLLWW